MRRFTVGSVGLALLATAVACLSQAAVASAGGGNSGNAHLCQKGGWQMLFRSDGSSFANQDACVSYGAQGGTLAQESQAQVDCQAFGGTYSADPATDELHGDFGPFLWSCNGFTDSVGEKGGGPNTHTLVGDCFAVGGGSVATASPPFDISCYQ